MFLESKLLALQKELSSKFDWKPDDIQIFRFLE